MGTFHAAFLEEVIPSRRWQSRNAKLCLVAHENNPPGMKQSGALHFCFILSSCLHHSLLNLKQHLCIQTIKSSMRILVINGNNEPLVIPFFSDQCKLGLIPLKPMGKNLKPVQVENKIWDFRSKLNKMFKLLNRDFPYPFKVVIISCFFVLLCFVFFPLLWIYLMCSMLWIHIAYWEFFYHDSLAISMWEIMSH